MSRHDFFGVSLPKLMLISFVVVMPRLGQHNLHPNKIRRPAKEPVVSHSFVHEVRRGRHENEGQGEFIIALLKDVLQVILHSGTVNHKGRIDFKGPRLAREEVKERSLRSEPVITVIKGRTEVIRLPIQR